MARTYDDTYSWVVAGAKIALPLTALALLSMLFLVSDRIDPTQPVPYADIDLDELAREPRITLPHFAGVTEDGAALSLSATEARTDLLTAGVSASGIVARLKSPEGFSADVTAGLAQLDPLAGAVQLSGGVHIATSANYAIVAEEVLLSTDRTRIESPGAITADAPFGQIEAGAMVLQTEGVDAPHLLVFNNGVKLVYQPVK